MKRSWLVWCVILIAVLLCNGCATTRWECSSSSCIEYDRAFNKCLAQANSAFAYRSVKQSIWEQCMRGEGYTKVLCTQHDRETDSRCALLHVF